MAEARLGVAPALTCKPQPSFRWLDALDHPYSKEFRSTFSYANSQVVVRFPKVASVFTCVLRALGLKPNFAYQIKLVGMPTFLWPKKGDEESNRRIGELGRWWRPGKDGGNAYFWADDKEPDKDKMEGYLLFGYFVTDAQGKAEVTCRLDSSYHVLWKTSQWPPAKEDTKPTRHRVVAKAASRAYDKSHPDGEVAIYAEAQRDRPAIGAVRLPPGRYRCFLLLTEESFHAWGDGHGGDWAAALAAPIEFTIVEEEGTAPQKKGERQ